MLKSGEFCRWPGRLYHETPGWVKSGSIFHVRLRVGPACRRLLTEPQLADGLLNAACHYHRNGHWYCMLFLLMPDHLHALLAFPHGRSMSNIVGSWKRYTALAFRVSWQRNFFDHRIRKNRGLSEKWHYILRNPVAKGLCDRETDWRWSWSPHDRAPVERSVAEFE